MLFNSWQFLWFLVVVLVVYYRLPHRGQNYLLLVASYVFYGAWDPRFLALLLISTSTDYFASLGIYRSEVARVRKRYLLASIVINLTLLGFFKYFGFFVGSAYAALRSMGLEGRTFHLNLILPVRISFYTFQTMGYTIDVYRGEFKPERNFADFALFVSFFPQLVAGPVERASRLLPQLTSKRVVTEQHVVEGIWLILWGYFQKVYVADNLSVIVDRIVAYRSAPSGLVCLLTIYCFGFQAYADFSGYSKIARGVARLFGIKLTRNFAFPLTASSPREFWHRWHISMSTWMRDYVYIPLGGNRRGRRRTYRNLFLTMLAAGLWHGASWKFVFWGALLGLLLVVHRALFVERRLFPFTGRLWKAFCFFVFFNINLAGLFFFRVHTLGQGIEFLRQIVTNFSIDPAAGEVLAYLLLFPGTMLLLEWWHRDREDPRTIPGWNLGTGALAVSSLALLLLLMAPPARQAFLYFQF